MTPLIHPVGQKPTFAAHRRGPIGAPTVGMSAKSPGEVQLEESPQALCWQRHNRPKRLNGSDGEAIGCLAQARKVGRKMPSG